MRLVSVLFVGLALWILPAGAQTTTMGGPPDPTDPFFTPTAACSGPLGSLIPECQPKNGVEGLLNPCLLYTSRCV